MTYNNIKVKKQGFNLNLEDKFFKNHSVVKLTPKPSLFRVKEKVGEGDQKILEEKNNLLKMLNILCECC